MSQLVFDESRARQLETLYRTRDVRRRRALVREALAARAGERVLDVGCGPGFFVEELLDEVGPDGAVVGVDASPQMLAAAAHRCASRGNVDFREGDATALPVEDASFDAALCVQVLEYVADPTAGARADAPRPAPGRARRGVGRRLGDGELALGGPRAHGARAARVGRRTSRTRRCRAR